MRTIYREYFEDRTEGVLELPNGEYIKILERPDLNNEPFVSCIPEGIYVVERDYTGKHQYFKLLNVPKRSFIEIHPANYVHQLEGCLAPCMEIENGVGIDSEKAIQKLLTFFENDDWVLRITH